MWPLYNRSRNEWYHYQREPEIGIAFYLSFVGSIICAIWMVTFNFFLVWDLTGSGYVVGQDTLLSQSLSSTRSINGYWGSVKEAWWNTWDKFVMDWHSFPLPPPPWGIVILLVTLCYRNWDGLQLDGQLGLSTDVTMYERFLCFPCRVFSVFCPLWEFLPLSFSKLWQLSRTQFKSKVSVVFVIIRNCTYH